MAKNGSPGNGRIGRVRNRIQAFNPRIKRWVKFDTKADKIIDVKADGKPFKNIRKHK